MTPRLLAALRRAERAGWSTPAIRDAVAKARRTGERWDCHEVGGLCQDLAHRRSNLAGAPGGAPDDPAWRKTVAVERQWAIFRNRTATIGLLGREIRHATNAAFGR